MTAPDLDYEAEACRRLWLVAASALAGITHRPEAIEQMLLSDKAKPTAALMRRAYGLIEGEV